MIVKNISIKVVENGMREVKKPAMVGIGNVNLEMMKGICF